MYCTTCGTQLVNDASPCNTCRNTQTQNPKPLSQIEGELKYLLPMGTPPIPLIAGYLGLFSVLIIPAPFALLFGIFGLKQLKKRDHSYGYGRCWTAIILGSIFTILPIVLLLIP